MIALNELVAADDMFRVSEVCCVLEIVRVPMDGPYQELPDFNVWRNQEIR